MCLAGEKRFRSSESDSWPVEEYDCPHPGPLPAGEETAGLVTKENELLTSVVSLIAE